MYKKFSRTILLIIFLSIFLFPQTASEAKEPVEIYFFWGDGCPHCAKEEIFLDQLKKEYNDRINIHEYEVWYNRENADLLNKLAKAYPDQKISGVPATFIGDKVIIGFNTETTTGKEIKNEIEYCLQNECLSPLGRLEKENKEDGKPNISKVFDLPFFGEIDLGKFSLPILTLVIAGLDGFNPCAMWVLIFLIGLLLGLKSRAKMWLLGLTFIAASALTYFIFLAAWLNIFLFIGYLLWTRIIIGILAAGIGLYYLREYWKNRSGECKVTQSPSRKKILYHLKEIAQSKKLLTALGGIIVLAFVVNFIEIACSAGFPAVYTQVLALNKLPSWQYYLYLVFYIIIFMLDDMIVFAVAMITLKATGLNTKYSRYSNLVGGLIILIIGLLMIFRPSFLTFA